MDSKSAAIHGSLVGLKQVGAHKSIVLSIHVPEELATRVIDAFGWPTGTNPVEVVVFRPTGSVQGRLAASAVQDYPEPQKAASGQPRAKAGLSRFPEPVPLVKHIALTCNDPLFHQFLGTVYGADNSESAACIVRSTCGVASRREIPDNPKARQKWLELEERYLAWCRQREARHVRVVPQGAA
jgi:hypothetical protein